MTRLLALALVLLAGCVDYARVSRIVDDSNAALVLADVDREAQWLDVSGQLGDAGERDAKKRAELDDRRARTIARIDEYVASHPGQLAVASSLRMRKAFLLLAARRPNQAREVFEAVDPSLLNGRDRSLHRHHGALVWWWMVAPEEQRDRVPPKEDFAARARELVDAAKEDASVAPYLVATRALLVLKGARLYLEGAEAREALRDGLANYAASFGERVGEVRAFYASDEDPRRADEVPLERARWYALVKSLHAAYVKAAEATQAGALDDPAWAWMKELD